MKHSDSLGAIGTALAKVNGELKSISKDKVNPQYSTKFVTLDAIIETVRPLLAKNGLSIIQGAATPHTDAEGQLAALTVETMILHESGEWVCASIVLPVGTKPIKDGGETIGHAPTAQTAGATLTYGRRYGLAMLLAVAADEDDDDDGNKASENSGAKRTTQARPAQAAKPKASDRVIGAIDRLPAWPAPYKFAGVPLKDAPLEELERVLKWEPKPDKIESYAPLKDAIALELDRRRAEPKAQGELLTPPAAGKRNDFETPSKALDQKDDDLPF